MSSNEKKIIWNTRPYSGANEEDPLNSFIKAHGGIVHHDPLLKYKDLPFDDASIPAKAVLVFTSAYAVERFCALSKKRNHTVCCIGDSTASLCRANGFLEVLSAHSQIEKLVALARDYQTHDDKQVVYLRGRDIRHELAGRFEARNYHEIILYEAVQATAFSLQTFERLQNGQIDAVLFYSARTAEAFSKIVESGIIADKKECTSCATTPDLEGISALCLAKPVLNYLLSCRFGRVHVAARTDREAFLGLLADFLSS